MAIAKVMRLKSKPFLVEEISPATPKTKIDSDYGVTFDNH